MSESNRVVVGRRVLTKEGERPAALHLGGGVIRKIAAISDIPPGVPVDDAGDAVVMAGAVDTHVHVNEPGRTEWEGFSTATEAAAAGGVTTVVDMPLNSIPATVSVDAVLRKVDALSERSFVDVALWGGAIPGNADQLRALLEAGVLGFKGFLVESGVDEFPPLSESGLAEALSVLAATGAPLLVHAELPGPIERASAGLVDDGSYEAYLRSRPRAAEDEAIALLARLVEKTRARAHVVHLSSASALDLLARARDAGLALTAETAPHYLTFEAERVPAGATEYKCAPPIREHANRERLWGGLRDGLVSMVVTDHSPCTPALKRRAEGRFDGAWGGIASLQFGVAALWTEASARGFTLADLTRWTAEAPAALAGLSVKKGSLEVGKDADLVFFAPDERFEVTSSAVRHRHKLTPYEGRTLRGVVRRTYLRGEPIFDRGQLTPKPLGTWLRRPTP